MTEPVGMELPEPPLTAAVTESAWAVLMGDAAGVTVKVGATACVDCGV